MSHSLRSLTRRRFTELTRLEDRTVPAVFTATIDPAVNNAGAITEIRNFMSAANVNADPTDTINLFAGGRYVFNDAFDQYDGGTALPVIGENPFFSGSTAYHSSSQIDNIVTINGNNATFYRPPGAPSFRFLRAVGEIDPRVAIDPASAKGPGLVVNDLSFVNGNVFDTRAPSRVDAIFPLMDGGAIRMDNADFVGTNLTFFQNTAADFGGAVAFDSKLRHFGSGVFTNSTFNENYAGKSGGAVFGDQSDSSPTIFSTVFMTNCTVNGNVSLTGAGGVQGTNYDSVFDTCKITNNRGDGGGVIASIVTATDSLFRGNTATGTGAGAVAATGNILKLYRCTVTENAAAANSAVVGLAIGRAVELLNTTVHNNTSAGAAVDAPVGEVVLSFSTVTNNRGTTGDSAGVNVEQNILAIYASVVAGNRVVNSLSTNVDIKTNQVRNHGFNLVGVVPTSYPRLANDLFGTADKPLDPLLSKLADNGGPVPTRAPAVGSPLLDRAGIPEATRIDTDARGFTRVVNGQADIGAFELQIGESFPNAEPPLPPLVILPPPPPPPPPPPAAAPTNVFAVGGGAGTTTTTSSSLLPANSNNGQPVNIPGGTSTGTVVTDSPNLAQLYGADGKLRLSVTPFSSGVPGGIRVASADFNNDGISDLVAATGAGVANLIRIFDGSTGQQLAELQPFESSFTGGLFISVGDITGDGKPELLVSPDDGGGPRVRVYTGSAFTTIADFFGINDPNFRGGARTAVGDMTGDGFGDLIVAAGTGGGPRISIFSGGSLSNGAFTTQPVGDFFLFDPSLRNGLYVAAGDLNGDGRADLIAGAGPGGGPRVLAISGRDLIERNGALQPLADFFSGNTSRRDGVPVAAHDLEGDGLFDIIAGGGSTGIVTGYLGKNLSSQSLIGKPDLSVTPFASFAGGVYVG